MKCSRCGKGEITETVEDDETTITVVVECSKCGLLEVHVSKKPKTGKEG